MNNSSKVYKINVVSSSLYIIRLLFSGAFPLAVILNINLDVRVEIFLGLYFIIALLIWLLTRQLSKGRILIEMNQEEIQITWQKQFFLHRRKDIRLNWSDVKDYKMEQNTFGQIQIRDRHDKKFTFSYDPSGDTDDFQNFFNDFLIQINTQNTRENDNSINRRKSFHETKSGCIVAIISFIMLISAMLFVAFSLKELNLKNGILLTVSSVMLLSFIIKVLGHYFSELE